MRASGFGLGFSGFVTVDSGLVATAPATATAVAARASTVTESALFKVCV